MIKLSAATGAELWKHTIDGSGGGLITQQRDVAEAVAIDASGAVVAAGFLDNGATGNDLFVVKYDTNGVLVWNRTIDGSASGSDAARDVSIDASGDVFVVGFTALTPTSANLFVSKLDGVTGADVWTYEASGGAQDVAENLVIDASGDVLVAGTNHALTFRRPSVLKFDGATGAVLWRYEPAVNGRADHVAVDGSGDVFAVARLEVFPASKTRLVKLDGATGIEIWRNDDEPSSGLGLAVTSAGDPVVARGNTGFAVQRFDGTSGAVVWRNEFHGTGGSGSTATAVALDSAGDVIAAGQISDDAKYTTGRDLAIVKMRATDGAVGGLSGRSLRVTDPGASEKRRLSLVVKDPTIRIPIAGSGADPSLHGAVVRLWNPATLEYEEYVLPAGPEWKLLGNPAGSKGFKFKSKTAPCKSLLIKKGKILRASCGSAFAPLRFHSRRGRTE